MHCHGMPVGNSQVGTLEHNDLEECDGSGWICARHARVRLCWTYPGVTDKIVLWTPATIKHTIYCFLMWGKIASLLKLVFFPTGLDNNLLLKYVCTYVYIFPHLRFMSFICQICRKKTGKRRQSKSEMGEFWSRHLKERLVQESAVVWPCI